MRDYSPPFIGNHFVNHASHGFIAQAHLIKNLRKKKNEKKKIVGIERRRRRKKRVSEIEKEKSGKKEKKKRKRERETERQRKKKKGMWEGVRVWWGEEGKKRREKEMGIYVYGVWWGKMVREKKKIICLLGAKCRLEEVYVIFFIKMICVYFHCIHNAHLSTFFKFYKSMH